MGGCSSGANAPTRRNQMIQHSSKKDLCCKVVLLGESFVGKSSIVSRYINDHFSKGHEVTVGGAFQQFNIQTKSNVNMKMNLWDTGGEERFRSMLKIYYKDANAALIVPPLFLS